MHGFENVSRGGIYVYISMSKLKVGEDFLLRIVSPLKDCMVFLDNE